MGCFPVFKRARNALVKLFTRRNNKVMPISLPENKILGTNEGDEEVVPQSNPDKTDKKHGDSQKIIDGDCKVVIPKPSENKNDIVTVEDLTLE